MLIKKTDPKISLIVYVFCFLIADLEKREDMVAGGDEEGGFFMGDVFEEPMLKLMLSKGHNKNNKC